VGVCGGIASDPQAIPILIGIGIDELSVSVPTLPTIKAEIRKYSMNECRSIAYEALACAGSQEVRTFINRKRRKKF
jgi:phosphocarrier protein FPr